ncbi:uncharacterized protein B0H18DRAFT_22127 [Fomitopsis serialis]|uniref:uncharacterized protein n=1 Tax=Fomitopsis serialis TaxID=139415 RepID=UPI002007DF5A|nr:uncharacterized protein B0H18DRAFT_22127 [Neoantrodia serialis]KAH9938645.1 hypothetical protein B0H18DRAFT_22127 [Neoantrodia serialis]
MSESSSLSRDQFETACKAYIAEHGTRSSKNVCTSSVYPSDWTWSEHQFVPALGYMSRSVPLSFKASEVLPFDKEDDCGHVPDECEDEATAPVSRKALTCTQSVVYSPTYRVPAFYFTVHHSNGVPLSLTEMMASSLLRSHAVPKPDATTFALSEQGASFPLLSQGDHPVLGTPAWYFHPCHTPEAVGEVMSEVHKKDGLKNRCLYVGWKYGSWLLVRSLISIEDSCCVWYML